MEPHRDAALGRARGAQKPRFPLVAQAVPPVTKFLNFAHRRVGRRRVFESTHHRRESQEQPTARYRATQISTRLFFAAPLRCRCRPRARGRRRISPLAREPFGRRASAHRQRVSHDVARAQIACPVAIRIGEAHEAKRLSRQRR